MNRKIVFVFFIIFTSIFLILYSISTTAAPSPPPPAEEEVEKERIKDAVESAVEDQRELVLGYLVNNVQVAEIQLAQDKNSGVVYLELVDSENGEVLPTEPGLAFALQSGGKWEIVLPTDPGWIDLLKSAPAELLSSENKDTYIQMYTTAAQEAQATYSGYLLPWDAGKTVYLSQSTGHDQYIPSGSAHYSFDFYVPQTMYRLRAAKAGTVWRTRWDVPNGNDADMGNYIVLKDETTSPTTYQLYLHLAEDSIPEGLKKIGAYVPQGEFIGMADDTGQSTGHHLHFQVHTNPNSYWGTSVDITFEDVDINGGRPRRESDLKYCTWPGDVCNQVRNNYVSANTAPGDSQVPIGEIFTPENGDTANSSSVHVEGWAFDEQTGINSIRLLAYFQDEWHPVGAQITESAFSTDWDMCSEDVPDGPVSLALSIQDNAGNTSIGLPGLTHIIKDYKCSQELIRCTPGPDQIAVYNARDYQGLCQVLNVGDYDRLNPDFDLNIESIQVGKNVVAEVFGNIDFLDRAESIHRNDSSLDDNLVRGNQIRSVKVTPRNSPLIAPQVLLYPSPGMQFFSGDSIPFSWRYSGPGNEFQVQVSGPSGTVTSDWVPNSFWIPDLPQLSPGVYTWQVRTRSCPDPSCDSPSWSKAVSFQIVASPPAMLSTQVPFADSLENGPDNWLTAGLWNLLDDPERSHASNHSWYYGLPAEHHYDPDAPNSGTLTSKPILIPEGNYALRFWYRYDTEEPGLNWDQRWLQISTNGSPFENILQLYDDVENEWLQATLDLTRYAGEEIQIRFLFATIDALENANGEGWLIDDIEIFPAILPDCEDGNDSPSTAESISFNQLLSRKICPTGDVDYYKFEGVAGDHIVVDINAQSLSVLENLDLYILLIDNDGKSVIAEHDDEIIGVRLDPHLGYQLKRSGTYYVRVRLYSHPSFGGEDFEYDISLKKDNEPPRGWFNYPLSKSYINDPGDIDLSIEASDIGSGISRVEFMYHSSDWQSADWQVIGTDQDSTDGWGITINANDYPEEKGAAFFANIYDWAGNWTGAGVWEIGFDHTPPVTVLQSLEPAQQSTAIQLNWSGSDNLSGMDFYQLLFKPGNGEWTNFLPDPAGSSSSEWFVGQPGITYQFRMRGVDIAGNLENFPEIPEAYTSIPSPENICAAADDWDKSGNDNSPAASTHLDLFDLPTTHNFCNPLVENRINDEDWFNFDVIIGQAYLIESQPSAPMSASILELYAADGTTLITSYHPQGLNEKSRILWTSDRTGKVYLRVRHLDGNIAGSIVTYQLKVNNFNPIFMPFIHK